MRRPLVVKFFLGAQPWAAMLPFALGPSGRGACWGPSTRGALHSEQRARASRRGSNEYSQSARTRGSSGKPDHTPLRAIADYCSIKRPVAP